MNIETILTTVDYLEKLKSQGGDDTLDKLILFWKMQANQHEAPVKPEIAEEKLRELFRNKADCYAYIYTPSKGNKLLESESESIDAITEDKFIEIVKPYVSQIPSMTYKIHYDLSQRRDSLSSSMSEMHELNSNV